eukprot:scaffold16515_cov57-Phaeocystis_antarctica.AAC.2
MHVILPARCGSTFWISGKSRSPSSCFCCSGGAAASVATLISCAKHRPEVHRAGTAAAARPPPGQCWAGAGQAREARAALPSVAKDRPEVHRAPPSLEKNEIHDARAWWER